MDSSQREPVLATPAMSRLALPSWPNRLGHAQRTAHARPGLVTRVFGSVSIKLPLPSQKHAPGW
jgi:hypothetical protein